MFDSAVVLNKSDVLFKPVQDEYRRRYEKAHMAGFDELGERDQVIIRGLRGLLSGLDKFGLLADLRRIYWDKDGKEIPLGPIEEVSEFGSVCLKCHRQLCKGALPKEALIAGTWQGIIPPELKNMSRTELDDDDAGFLADLNERYWDQDGKEFSFFTVLMEIMQPS